MEGNHTYINKLNVIGNVNTVHYNERLIHLKPEPEFCGILQGYLEFKIKENFSEVGVKFTYIYK